MMAGLAAASATAAGVELVRAGQPVAAIYVNEPLRLPDKCQTLEDYRDQALALAVEDLVYHLEKMSGARLPVRVGLAPDPAVGPAVIIGVQAHALGAAPTVTSATREGFRLKTAGSHVLVGGESASGLAFGLYELLRQLGCDWVMPGEIGEVIPARDDVAVPELDICQAPAFSVRFPWYSGGRATRIEKEYQEYDQWKRRHKMQTGGVWDPRVGVGGHVWQNIIRTNKAEFDANPEMLALVRQLDGSFKRRGPQLEPTHPRVIELFEKHIRDTFRKNHWAADATVGIGIGPADGGGFSESVESYLSGSGRRDPMSGAMDVTDNLILLCNTLLENLDAEFPNLHLGFYLYSNHADIPTRHRPHPRLAIVIADITYSRLHGTLEPQSKTRAYFKAILDKWGELPNAKFFRGYNWNLAENFMPFSKVKIWGEDLPYYRQMGILGVRNESIRSWACLAPTNYVEARLLWDTSQDWRQLVADFCRQAYGKGAPFMEQYYLMQAQRQSAAGQEAGSYHAFPLIYDQAFMTRAGQLFASAAAAADTAADRERVEVAAIPLRQMQMFFDFRDALHQYDFAAAQAHFEALKQNLEGCLAREQALCSHGAVTYLNRFWKEAVATMRTYSSGDYQIAFRIPDRLKTMLDPYDAGAEMGFFRPEINDENHITTATYSSTWDAQGLGGYVHGAVWYRVRFPALAEKTAGLLFGGVDSVVKVWCNGQYIGMGAGFAKPQAFDLTGTLVEQGENLLAIQVVHNSSSELGTGGIVYPAFVFTGPRLAQRAPKIDLSERVLPGGAREKASE
ncbi:MAG: DUF4838 domain-containing protein [Lentisphaeria bacterium]|nr:DUF4838 domain-containing protein [Lentisphaeria bacterium]